MNLVPANPFHFFKTRITINVGIKYTNTEDPWETVSIRVNKKLTENENNISERKSQLCSKIIS